MVKTILLLSLIFMALNTYSKVIHIYSHKDKNSLLVKHLIDEIITPINQKHGKTLKLKIIYPTPKLSYQNHKIFNATKFGEIDGHFTVTMYWKNADERLSIIGDLPGVWTDTKQFEKWLKEFNGLSYLRNIYSQHNMYFVNFSIAPLESFVSMVPIRKLSDFRGKIIRTPPGSVASYFYKSLGAIPRPLPINKVKDALITNKLDIADYATLAVNEQDGLYKIARHTTYPGFHSTPIFELVMNKETWNKIPKNIQKDILEKSESWKDKLYKNLYRQNELTLKKLKKMNINIHTWKQDELNLLKEKSIEIWKRYAQENPKVSPLINSIIKSTHNPK